MIFFLGELGGEWRENSVMVRVQWFSFFLPPAPRTTRSCFSKFKHVPPPMVVV